MFVGTWRKPCGSPINPVATSTAGRAPAAARQQRRLALKHLHRLGAGPVQSQADEARRGPGGRSGNQGRIRGSSGSVAARAARNHSHWTAWRRV